MSSKNDSYARDASLVLRDLGTNEHGLSSDDAVRRLSQFGSNELPDAKREGVVSIFLRQFKSPLIFILLLAAVAVVFIGDFSDALVIFFVLVFNATIGAIQEGKAQNTFLALKKFIKGGAYVLRDGEETIVPDTSVVPGDVILLREGDKVPADARVIASHALRVDEAALTGESMPKHKDEKTLDPKNDSYADRTNGVFKGTVVVSGNGKAVVTATGSETYLGGIARETLGIDAEFPLKNELKRLSRFIIFFVSCVSASLLALGLSAGQPIVGTLKTIIAVAVSIIPEGLPIVMTLVLASGVWRMSRKNVLVKKLQAVEVLGETKILAVDKTGTVTRNELAIERVYAGGRTFAVGGIGYDPDGNVTLKGDPVDPLNHPELLLAGKIAAINSGASLLFDKASDRWTIAGDPTEGALSVFARKVGFNRDEILTEMPILDEIPFDYEKKYHATLHRSGGRRLLVLTGAPETVIGLCGRETIGCASARRITRSRKKELEDLVDSLSDEGLRIIGFASVFVKGDRIGDGIVAGRFVLGGFFAIKDTLREGVREAVRQVEESKLRVVMITGDNALTARSIAREAGIYKDGDDVLDGTEIDRMDDGELARRISEVSVFSRVTPKHKLRIIRAYRMGGTVVAMTGDGVNDALSLSAADIGIGMGKIGTEVAKEASDIILLDDDFGSIVHGVNEGRHIFATMRKVTLYLFSTSLGEVFALVGSLLLGMPLPILAAQILWLNLVTDGFLDVALAMEPNDGRKRPFTKAVLVDRSAIRRMVFMAVPMAIGTLFLFSRNYEVDIEKAWTVSLTTLAVFQWFNAWNCRSIKRSVFSMNPFSNRYLLAATAVVVLLQLLAVYHPLFQGLLRTTSLSLADWALIVPVAFSIVVVEEARKYFVRRAQSRRG